ncbi:MAG: hypothetical protein V1782_03030 [Pseudomonadota bacterium]
MIKPLGRVAVLTFAVLVLLGWLLPESARADRMDFFVDYGYNTTSSETSTRESDGTTTTSHDDSDLFAQEYRLLFDKRLYPYLTLRGGGTFVRTGTKFESDDESGDSTNIRKNPFVDLMLGSPLFSGGVGVNRFQDETRSSDGARSLLTRDIYTASLGWKPLDLPSFNLRTTRSETYDDNRVSMDTLQEQVNFSSRYQPNDTTDLSYSASLDRNRNILSDTETQATTQSGRASYANRFFKNRVNFSSMYSVSRQTTEVTSGGGGEFDAAVPILDLESYNELMGLLTPRQPLTPPDPLFPVGASVSTTISAPLVRATGDLTAIEPLNIALDFGLGLTANMVRIRVDHDLPTGLTAGTFGWKVFGVDANNEWQEIALQSVVFTSLFGTSQFELRFPSQRSQYLKVVATPQRAGNTEIKVTAVEALLRQAAAVGGTKTAQTGHMYNMASRVKILEDQGLDYNFALFYRLNDPGSYYRLFVSNGPSLYRRLSPWLSGNAMFTRDDSMETDQKDQDVTYRYGAGLTATPLPTLNSSLNYSGRNALQDGEHTEQNAFTLNNRAVLYPGLDMLLGGALSYATLTGKVKSESSQINMGLNIVPHRTMSWNLIGFLNRTNRSGGDRPDSVSNERRGLISVSYSPVSALSFFLSHEADMRDEDKDTLQNYGISWSPFRDGALQLGFSYTESVRPEDEALDRVLSPSLTWKIRQSTYLDLSYAMIETRSATQETESLNFSARLRAMF